MICSPGGPRQERLRRRLRRPLRPVSGNVTRGRATGNEHVFAAVVGNRLAGEAAVERLQLAVERLQLEVGDVKEPSHSFLVAHHRELVAPSSRVMSIRLSPTAYRFVCGTGSS